MATTITRRQIREGAARELGLMMTAVADTVNTTDHTIKASDVREKSPDPFLVRDAFVVPREAASTGNQFRRIVQFSTPETPDTLILAGGPDGLSNGDDIGIYYLLDPTEWNDCVNEALYEMWKRINVPFDFVENDNDYPCDLMEDPDDALLLCTWITTRGQIETVKIKHVITGSLVDEREWAGYVPIESGNAVVLHFTYLPAYQATVTGILVANKPYAYPGATLDTDQETTVCPFMLAVKGTQVMAMKKAYKKYGTEAMRARFGSTLAVAESEWAKLKMQWMPPMRTSGYIIDETFEPDIPEIMRNPPW